MRPAAPPPELPQIMRILDGARLHAALASALELHLFEHLAAGPASAAELARRAGISERGAQALLDTSVALELVTVEGGTYRNTAAAEQILVPSGPFYVGDEFAAIQRNRSRQLDRLTETVRSGSPGVAIDAPEVLEFWALLTPFIARMGRPVAAAAVAELGLADGEPHLVDVGGGMALYAQALLAANPRARATQVDWPHINEQARATLARDGLAERFETLDGDFRVVDLGEGRFDVAVLSNIVHQESPDSNRALIARLHRALKPGGRLLISEFVVDDGRTGPPSSLFFNINMIAMTDAGKSYERRELTEFVTGAGFEPPRFIQTGPMATLVVAERR